MLHTLKNWWHLLVALFANYYFGFPGKKIEIIGITGTDGKTTTVNLVYHILAAAGKPVSMISTVGAIIHGKKSPLGFHITTPSSISLQRFLKMAVEEYKGSEKQYVVIEVSSHSLDQFRIWGIPFSIGGVTNITHEHFDYHKTYEKYVKAKTKLLNLAKTAVINVDDDSFSIIKKYLKKRPDEKIITYGITKKADKTPRDIPSVLSFKEEYNQYNALLAGTICQELGIDQQTITKAMKSFSLPLGRTDLVYQKNFSVMIDFAHTPNGFKQLLSMLRPKVKGRLIHVFGVAGKRDKSKRPVMGKISSEFADVMILTSEDPRNEPVEKINNEVISGIPAKKRNTVEIITLANRQEAINYAVKMAKRSDFIVLTGKGHEQSLNVGHGEDPWDEYKAVKEALRKRDDTI